MVYLGRPIEFKGLNRESPLLTDKFLGYANATRQVSEFLGQKNPLEAPEKIRRTPHLETLLQKMHRRDSTSVAQNRERAHIDTLPLVDPQIYFLTSLAPYQIKQHQPEIRSMTASSDQEPLLR